MAESLTSWLTGAGYWLAAFMLATFPAAVLYWVLIHPFARFWRQRGPALAYTVVTIICLGLATLIFQFHQPLLALRWPFSWWLVALGLFLYGPAIWLEVQCRRQLKLRTLLGAPELGREPGRVLTGGIYGRLRHPRYLSIILGVGAWACFLNYPTIWALAIAVVPGFYLVILLEERELRDRFGDEYEAFMRAVPNRLLPRLGKLG
jgi:protein-S-isoprenylcysteine O-methyltransferase Ste14